MLIGLIADTHIRGVPLPPQVLRAFQGVDLILHAGDIYSLDVLDQLEALLRKFDALPHIVVFGDTHQELVARHQGVLFVNPGLACIPILGYDPQNLGTVALMEMGGMGWRCAWSGWTHSSQGGFHLLPTAPLQRGPSTSK